MRKFWLYSLRANFVNRLIGLCWWWRAVCVCRAKIGQRWQLETRIAYRNGAWETISQWSVATDRTRIAAAREFQNRITYTWPALFLCVQTTAPNMQIAVVRHNIIATKTLTYHIRKINDCKSQHRPIEWIESCCYYFNLCEMIKLSTWLERGCSATSSSCSCCCCWVNLWRSSCWMRWIDDERCRINSVARLSDNVCWCNWSFVGCNNEFVSFVLYNPLLGSVVAVAFNANDVNEDDEDDADDNSDELVASIASTATFDSVRLISIDVVWSIADGNNWLFSPVKWGKKTQTVSDLFVGKTLAENDCVFVCLFTWIDCCTFSISHAPIAQKIDHHRQHKIFSNTIVWLAESWAIELALTETWIAQMASKENALWQNVPFAAEFWRLVDSIRSLKYLHTDEKRKYEI